jgi:hypothetical protein
MERPEETALSEFDHFIALSLYWNKDKFLHIFTLSRMLHFTDEVKLTA